MPSGSGSVRVTSSGGCPGGRSKLARPESVYRQKRVDEGLDEAPVLWTESEAVQKAEHAWRRAAEALEAERLTIARRYGGGEWSRLRALLAAMTR